MKCQIDIISVGDSSGDFVLVSLMQSHGYSNHFEYISLLMLIHDHEKYLDDGRFKYFKNIIWGNFVCIKAPWDTNDDGYFKNFNVWINWINTNKIGYWFFTMEYDKEKNICFFEFDFADKQIATIFKLAFY